jgi:hypothetical protein
MSRYTLFLDVAGRVSKETRGYEYITCAGVALESVAVPRVRSALRENLPKWKHSKSADLIYASEFIVQHALTSLVLRVEKQEPFWSRNWEDADDYCKYLSRHTKKSVGFAKAAQFIRYMLFGECSGRLIGECVRSGGVPRLLDQNGHGIVEVSAVCDSDIQGEDNIAAFHFLWEKFESSPQKLLAGKGIRVSVRSTSLAAEEEEPLLLCPDHLAGLFHSMLVAQAKPWAASESAIVEARAILGKAGKVVVVDKGFDIQYREIYGKGEVGRELWGDA